MTPTVAVSQLAERWACHRNTVLKLIRRGEFPNSFRVGTKWQITEADIAAYIERHKVGTTTTRAAA